MNVSHLPRLLRLAMVALFVLPLFGCEASVPTHPVTGTVMLGDGSLAGGGIIKFRTTSPDGETIKAHGLIQPDGSFRLTTFQEGDGALEGEHQAILFTPAISDGESTVAVPSFPKRYRKYETSGLTFHVIPGENDFQIQLETR
ncbi:hypothetical protein AB1K70_20435 [Bremerella sp. JC770]|uniref:hypothetical protein n=1 Tax=Bremerella sp. JC770 TaxID=3232137 RepID=UPI0034584C28